MQRDLQHNGHSSELPKVVLITTREETTAQDYENLEVRVVAEKEDIAAFNEALDEADDGDLLFFLPKTDNFLRPDAISKMVARMNNPFIGSVYCDNINDFIPIRYATFTREIMMGKKLINSCMLYRKSGKVRFSDMFPTLYLYKFLMETATPTTVPVHLAEILIQRTGCEINTEEFKLLKE